MLLSVIILYELNGRIRSPQNVHTRSSDPRAFVDTVFHIDL